MPNKFQSSNPPASENSWRGALSATRADVWLLLALLAGMFIQGVLFLMGFSCSGWPMWSSFSAVAIMLGFADKKAFTRFGLLAVFCFVLTAYSFSYTVGDSMSYHFPMQDLLRRGWNPVYAATVEDFRGLNLIGGHTMGMMHTLFLPRLSALCGA